MKPLIFTLALSLYSASAIEITEAVWPDNAPGAMFDGTTYSVSFVGALTPGSDERAADLLMSAPFSIGVHSDGITLSAGWCNMWEICGLEVDLASGQILRDLIIYETGSDQGPEFIEHLTLLSFDPQTGNGSITWSPPASQVPDNSFPIALLALGIIAVATKTRT